MNQVHIIGNLTKDPDFRTTQSGLSCCQITVAVNRRYKNADGSRTADYPSVVMWRELADLANKYLRKGSKVAVTGSLQTRSYDAQDGSKRFVTEVLASELDFLTSSQGQHQQPDNSLSPEPPQPPQRTPAPAKQAAPAPASDFGYDEDDLPF